MQNKSFFDLKAVFAVYWQRWLHGWSELCETPILRRLLPSLRVQVVDAQHPPSVVSIPGFETVPGVRGAPDAQTAEFIAVTLPESAYLQRRIDVPVMSIAESRSAMQLEVEAASPFDAEQTVWGWRAVPARQDFFAADVVITSRELIDRAISSLALPVAQIPEIWARLDSGYVVVDGFGEGKRLRAYRRQMGHFFGLLALVGLLLLALAITPLVQKRTNVIDAQSRQAELMRQSGEVSILREQLNTLYELHENLGPRLNREKSVAVLLDHISAVLPDGAWLSFFEYSPGKMRISGYADDASALQRKLLEQPEFSNVRQSGTVSRDKRLNKDRFNFELDLPS